MIKVSLFGSLAEAIGRQVELPAPGSTVGDVRRRLIELYPAAAASLSRPAVRACVEDRIVDDGHELSGAAELAFLPPLSGG